MASIFMGLQESAAEYANTTLAQMNEALLDMYGIDVMWFRSTPQKRSTDVIFQAYTLHNVEPCPLNIKVMYNDLSYDDAALTFSYNGIDYKPTLTLEMPVGTWYKATENDGTLPQKNDIVFIPQTRKLWQVATMTPVSSMGGQITSFKTMMETYVPRADRLVAGDLEESIEESTVSVDKLFGDIIDKSISDLVDDKQSSNKSSTERDKYKDLTKTPSKYHILRPNEVNYTIMKRIEIDGHIIARSYYNLDIKSPIVVEYKNINDEVTIDDTRCLSLWVNLNKNENKSFGVEKIEDKGSDKTNAYYQLTTKADSGLKVGDEITIKRNSITIYATIDAIEGKEICVSIPTSINRILMNSCDCWTELGNFKIQKDGRVNLLSGESENGDFSIDILGGKYISLLLNGKTYISEMENDMETEKWYGFIMNLTNEFEVNVFTESEELKKISQSTIRTRWDDNVFTRYYIKRSNACMTNIRYYTMGNYEIDKQLTDLVTYNIKNNSLTVINDSADIYMSNGYYGEQR